jgi:hypothetical protein
MFFHHYLDYAPADKSRQKLLLSSRDWETLATEYDYLKCSYISHCLF